LLGGVGGGGGGGGGGRGRGCGERKGGGWRLVTDVFKLYALVFLVVI